MSLRINHNIASINGHRNMLRNDAAVSSSLEKLSSGLRINKAADDAAGLIISEQMRAQIGGLEQATANAEIAVSLVQTAEGALDEMNTLLNKARSLALHAANEGANDTAQLLADQSELDNIIESVDRIAQNTQFGTKKILDGSLSFGSSNSDAISSVKLGGDYANLLEVDDIEKGYHTIQIDTVATRASALLAGGEVSIMTEATMAAMSGSHEFQESFSISIMGAEVDVASGTTKDQLIQQLNAVGSSVGFSASVTGAEGDITLTATDYGADITIDGQFASGASGATTLTYVATVGVDAAATMYLYTGEAGVGGTATTDAGETIALAASGNGLRLVSTGGSTINLAAAVATGVYAGAIDGTAAGATFQIGANAGQTATVQLSSVTSADIGVGGSATYDNLTQLKGSSLVAGNAEEALKVIDQAINDITTTRGDLGAFQSATLESTLSSLRVTTENLVAAESTIRDVDFAKESAEFTKNNILIQASTAMLAQANQLPQNVLQLLG
ncbi:MAG: hypothetical protein HRU15_17225 [Planctomycetes bacterium]|nr:hypothetical protein [Planctomycetota bacterium]